MRKLMASMLAVAVLGAISAVMAAAPTHAAVDGVYEWKLDTTISSSAGLDTFTTAGDSLALLTGFRPDQKWEYILQRDACTGTAADGSGSDSVKVQVRVDCFNSSGSLLTRTNIDSFTTAPGENILLDFGGTLFAEKINIKLVAIADIGSQLILNRFSIWQRRAVTVNKAW
jgi:hypothetical protein